MDDSFIYFRVDTRRFPFFGGSSKQHDNGSQR